jgi:hypothetical protein
MPEEELVTHQQFVTHHSPIKTGKLAEALAKAQAGFTTVIKSKTAKGEKFSYKYADLADVLEMVVPALSKQGIAFTQPLRREGDKTFVITRIQLGDEFLEDAGLPIPSQVRPQELGTYLTYYRRYSVSTFLGISTDEDTDAVETRDDYKPSSSGQVTKRATPVIHQPAQGVQVTPAPKFVADESDVPVNIGSAPTKEEMASIKESLKSLGIDNDKLKAYSLKVAGRTAVRDITRQEWQAIITGLTAAKTAGNLEQLVA